MNIYDDYLGSIRNLMSSNSSINENKYRNFTGLGGNEDHFEKAEVQQKEQRLLPSLETFAKELGVTPNLNQPLGLHPDFSHLKNTERIEKHYIVSMFIDIKGSTNLFRHYDPIIVAEITKVIQQAAIHTCLIFGGYIHRLQGDGLFVYFGGKSMLIKDAVEKSLQSASAFSYFVKNDLKKLFSEYGVEDIFTRIGIDLGYDEQVVWSQAGIGMISEITTCSLHTSLAAKMQGNAESNGVVVGDHIKDEIPHEEECFNVVSRRTNIPADRYVFQIAHKSFNYTQYDFNWLKYLKKQSYVAVDYDGNLRLKKKEQKPLDPNLIMPIASLNKPYFK